MSPRLPLIRSGCVLGTTPMIMAQEGDRSGLRKTVGAKRETFVKSSAKRLNASEDFDSTSTPSTRRCRKNMSNHAIESQIGDDCAIFCVLRLPGTIVPCGLFPPASCCWFLHSHSKRFNVKPFNCDGGVGKITPASLFKRGPLFQGRSQVASCSRRRGGWSRPPTMSLLVGARRTEMRPASRRRQDCPLHGPALHAQLPAPQASNADPGNLSYTVGEAVPCESLHLPKLIAHSW